MWKPTRMNSIIYKLNLHSAHSCSRAKGTEVIRSKLEEYVSSLKKDFSQGLILPTKDNGAAVKAPTGANSTGTKVNEHFYLHFNFSATESKYEYQ